MSGRMNRCKDAIASTRSKIRLQIIEADQKRQWVPAYAVGLHNGLAMADNALNDRGGMYGMLPVPKERTPFPSPSNQDEQEYEALVDQILTAAREVCLHHTPDAGGPMDQLMGRINELDIFIDDRMKEAEIGESVQLPDAGLHGQDGSIPPSAPNSEATNG